MKWDKKRAGAALELYVRIRELHNGGGTRAFLEESVAACMQTYESVILPDRAYPESGYLTEAGWLAHRYFIDFILSSELSPQRFWVEAARMISEFYEMIEEEIETEGDSHA